MGKSKIGLRQLVLVPFVVAILILLGLSVFSIYVRDSNELDARAKRRLLGAEQLFNDKIKSYGTLPLAFLELIERKEEFQKSWIDKDRQLLFDQALPIFKDIKSKYEVTHFYFIDSNGACFLRMHKPDRYSDPISHFVLKAAQKSGVSVQGLEVGQLGTLALRKVYPWEINGEVFGYIELGEEVGHIIPKMKDINGSDFILAVEKSCINRAQWEEGLKAMGNPGDWDQFERFVVACGTMPKIPRGIEAGYNANYGVKTKGIFRFSGGGHFYRGGCVPLVDASGRTIGSMFVLLDTTQMERSLWKLFILLILLCMGISSILIAFFYWYLGGIEDRITRDENEIVEAKRFTEETLNTLPDGFYAFDTKGAYLLGNKTLVSITGYNEKELSTMKISDFFSKEDAIRVMKAVDKVMIDGSAKVEADILTKDRRSIPFEFNSSILKDSKGNTLGIAGTARNITERRKIETSLQGKIHDLEVFNKVAVERELKMVELKKQIEELRAQLNKNI